MEVDTVDLEQRLSRISGIGPSTVETIFNEYSYYEKDIGYILNQTNFQNAMDNLGTQAKAQIRFTGCRNLQLQEQLSKLGYDIDGNASVTKKTNILLVPYEGFHSNKISKAGKDCKIVPIGDFQKNPEQYL
jgi:hypothetical protein